MIVPTIRWGRGPEPSSIAFSTPWRCVPSFGGGKDLKITRHLQGGWLPIPVTTVDGRRRCLSPDDLCRARERCVRRGAVLVRDRALCVAEYQVKNGGDETADARSRAEILRREKNNSVPIQEVKEGVLVVRGRSRLGPDRHAQGGPAGCETRGGRRGLVGQAARRRGGAGLCLLPGVESRSEGLRHCSWKAPGRCRGSSVLEGAA